MTNTDVTKMTFFAPDPKLMTVDLNELTERHREIVAKRDAAEPPPSKADLHREYNQLRQRLFDLRQNAKTFEIRTNEAAGRIHLLEQRINETLKLKKAAAESGNLRGERTYEHQVASLESELLDVKDEYEKNKQWSIQSARALKSFDGHGRIAELNASLSLPVAKTNNRTE